MRTKAKQQDKIPRLAEVPEEAEYERSSFGGRFRSGAFNATPDFKAEQ